MRCGCPECGTYMVHSESFELGCVCPECGRRCKQCLGTDTVIDRKSLKEQAAAYLNREKADAHEWDDGDE